MIYIVTTHDYDCETCLYRGVFMILTLFYVFVIFTSIYAAARIVRSLNFISQFHIRNIRTKLISVLVLTILVQFQFIFFILFTNWHLVKIDSTCKHESTDPDRMFCQSCITNTCQPCDFDKGLCINTPFLMILTYIEFIILSIIHFFGFPNSDFNKYFKDNYKGQTIHEFIYVPNYELMNDLHNYRRVYGPNWKKDLDKEIDHDHEFKEQLFNENNNNNNNSNNIVNNTPNKPLVIPSINTQSSGKKRRKSNSDTTVLNEVFNTVISNPTPNPSVSQSNFGDLKKNVIIQPPPTLQENDVYSDDNMTPNNDINNKLKLNEPPKVFKE